MAGGAAVFLVVATAVSVAVIIGMIMEGIDEFLGEVENDQEIRYSGKYRVGDADLRVRGKGKAKRSGGNGNESR